MGQLDRCWERQPADKRTPLPPSAYQKSLYYDAGTNNEEAPLKL